MKAKLVVKGIIINRNKGKILLLKRNSEAHSGPESWENPGGKIKKGETPEEALKREILEEAGIDIKIGNLAYLTFINTEEPSLFLVWFCEAESENITLSSEHKAFIWADKSLCRELVTGGIAEDFNKNGIYDISWSE